MVVIVAVSLHGHRYFFPYGKATDAGAPFTRETLVEIGSCTKTFTTTLFALAINRNQIVPDASAQKYMPNGYTLRASGGGLTTGDSTAFNITPGAATHLVFTVSPGNTRAGWRREHERAARSGGKRHSSTAPSVRHGSGLCGYSLRLPLATRFWLTSSSIFSSFFSAP